MNKEELPFEAENTPEIMGVVLARGSLEQRE